LTGETDVDPTPGANFDFAVARFNSDGSLDSGTVGDSTPADHFGTAGVTTVGFDLISNGYDDPIAIARQSDAKLVLAGGAATDNSGGEQWALARLNADGTLDNSGPGAFSGDGKLTFVMGPAGSGEEAKAVKVQQDGKIVAAGGAKTASTGEDFAIVRLTSVGAFDQSFDQDGIATTPVSTSTANKNDVAR